MLLSSAVLQTAGDDESEWCSLVDFSHVTAVRHLPLAVAGACPVWVDDALLLFGGFTAKLRVQQSNFDVVRVTFHEPSRYESEPCRNIH